MAEVIGILSGAVTFIDTASKVLKFFSNLQHVPQKIESHQEQLRLMLQLVQSIERDLNQISHGTGFIPRTLISQLDLDEVMDLVQQALSNVKKLGSMLDGCAGPSNITRLKRSWKALRAQDKISESFQELAALRGSLQVWLNRLTFRLTGCHHVALQALEGHFDSAHQATIQSAGSIETSLVGAMRFSQNALNQRLDSLEDQIGMVFQAVSRQSRPPESHSASLTGSQSVPTSSHALSQPYNRNVLALAPTCTCKSRPAPYSKFWGPVSLRSRTKNVHEKGCPLYGKSAHEVILTVRLSFLQYTLNSIFGQSGVSFNQQIKVPAHIVDEEKSDAFQLIRQFDRCLGTLISSSRTGPMLASSSESLFRLLTEQLLHLFQQGRASVHDQNKEGETLLYHFAVKILRCRRYVPSEAVDSVISTLLAHGADFGCSVQRGGLLSRGSLCWYYNRGSLNRFSFEDDLFLEDGYDFQGIALYGIFPEREDYVIAICFRYPELAQDLGWPIYYVPIFQKSAAGLRCLNQQGHNWNEWDHRFPAPIWCAVHWLEGLSILLETGPDVRYALGMVIYLNLEDAFQLLVEKNCPAFWSESGSEEMRSILEWHPCTSEALAETAVRCVARNRKLLAQIGLENLPPKTPLHGHLLDIAQRGVLLDEHALDVWEAVKARGVNVPEFLWPGTKRSVYFTFISFPDELEGECLLYNHGFKDLNTVDEQGWTPLLRALFKHDHRAASVLLEHGAQANPDYIWAYARNAIYPDPEILAKLLFTSERNAAQPPRGPLTGLSSLQRDECSCYCSPSGCFAPVRALQRVGIAHIAPDKRNDFVSLLSKFPQELQETCYVEFCRLEVFERLGMAHTCCREADWCASDFSAKDYIEEVQLAPEEREEMQDEDRTLRLVLEAYMELFKKLRANFQGSSTDFLRAWWAALDVLLPLSDVESSVTSEQDLVIDGRSEETTENSTINWIDSQGFCAITRHFFDLLPPISRYLTVLFRTGDLKGIEDYISSAGVSLTDTWYTPWKEMQTIPGFIDPYRETRRERFEARKIPILVPLTTAAVIKDIDAGCGYNVPTELYDYLVSEGVVIDGKLRECSNPLGTQSSSSDHYAED